MVAEGCTRSELNRMFSFITCCRVQNKAELVTSTSLYDVFDTNEKANLRGADILAFPT